MASPYRFPLLLVRRRGRLTPCERLVARLCDALKTMLLSKMANLISNRNPNEPLILTETAHMA